MREKPKVSVVMPAYNAERFIAEAIESILMQTYGNLELIVVEDSSDDNTRQIIRRFSDRRIIVEENQENKGIAYSTNRAIEMSSGEYIALMDDDDVAFGERLRIQVDYMEDHPYIDILGGRAEVIDVNGEHISFGSMPKRNPKYIMAYLLFRCLGFPNGTAMIRRDFIGRNHLQYRDGYLGMQDYQFYIESSKCGKISAVDDFLIKYRLHDGNETKRQMESNGKERERLYGKMREASLYSSGYRLERKELDIMNKVLKENNGHFDDERECYELRDVFLKIKKQASQMGVDYLEELDFVIKRLFTDCLYRSDLLKI